MRYSTAWPLRSHATFSSSAVEAVAASLRGGSPARATPTSCSPRQAPITAREQREDGRPTYWTERRSSHPTTGGTPAAPLPGREPIAFPRARVMGGCSSHNGCVVAVGCPADYDGWAALTGDDRWSASAIRPALARALARMSVRTYREDEVGPFHRACLDAASELGLPRADDLDDLDGGLGFGIEPVNIDRRCARQRVLCLHRSRQGQTEPLDPRSRSVRTAHCEARQDRGQLST